MCPDIISLIHIPICTFVRLNLIYSFFVGKKKLYKSGHNYPYTSKISGYAPGPAASSPPKLRSCLVVKGLGRWCYGYG